MESVLDTDVTGADVGNHLRYKEGIELGTQCVTGLGIVSCFLLESLHSTDSDTKDNTYTVLVDGLKVQTAVVNCHGGSRQAVLAIGVHLPGLFTVDEFRRVEVLNFAGKLCFEFRTIEMCDRSGTAYTSHHVLPSLLGSITQGADSADSGHYNSFQFHV